MQPSSPLLAERRRATWLAIHRAASEAVTRAGLDITVAEIADAAGVSTRTFFNYFASKEDAVLGVKPPRMREDAIEAFNRNPEDLTPAHRLAVLIADIASTTTDPDVDLAERRRLAGEHPVLHQRMVKAFHDSRALVISELIESSERPWEGADALHQTHDEALALLHLSAAMVIFAFSQVPDGVHRGDRRRLDETFAAFSTLAKRSL